MPRPAAHQVQPQPNTAGRTPLAAVSLPAYPAHARSHTVWSHAWQIWAPTATWTVDPPLEDLTPSDLDSEEEEESEADEPAALAARLSHLRAPPTDLATSGLLNE